VRAGAFALSLLSVPLNVNVLRALEEGPKSLVDLRRAVGSPPQTTMRGHLRALADLEVLDRRRNSQFPGPVDYELGPRGNELIEVARIVERWLERAPEGPVELGTQAGKSTLKALADGWSAGVVRALVAKPLALTELSRLITGLSYPSLERRLGAMRLVGLIERHPANNRGTPYAVTPFLRAAVPSLAAAARWERTHLPPGADPVGRIDVEAALLLALPKLRLPEHLSGTCRLVVELRGGERRLAGVLVGVAEGRVVSCRTRLQGEAAAWAAGSLSAWFRTALEGDGDELEVGGDCELAFALVRELSNAPLSLGSRA
jgi:DNA-binding HxlR family transcriptional regulator